MARPTKYSKELLQKAKDYVIDPTIEGDIVPTTAGLSLVLNVARSTLYEWGEAHVEFSDMLEDLQAKQERELVVNGLTSIFNPAITKLMLSKHGYTDKQDITSGDKPLTPLLVRFLGDATKDTGDTK